jgi:hypothetical protein
VQYYLGYRSTDDPLFWADKTMRRLEVLVPPDDAVAFLDAMENSMRRQRKVSQDVLDMV